MADQLAFSPITGSTVSLAVTSVTGNVNIPTQNFRHIRVWNSGTAAAFIELGGVSVTASVTTSMPIPGGNTEVFAVSGQYLAGITSTGTCTLYITPGEGI